MRRLPFLTATILLLTGACANQQEWTQKDRERYAADLRDAIAAVTPFVGEEGKPYLDALRPIADALESGEVIDWHLAFDVVRGLEPQMKAALLAGGHVTEAEANALIAACRMALRHAEDAVL